MARKRKAYLHIGLAHTGGRLLESALTRHSDALDEHGLRQPVGSPEEMFRATVEIRRDHRAWGFRRRDVEGTWAEICRRVHRGHHDVILSHERLGACTPGQIELLLDGLAGFEIHLIVTARDLGSQLLAAWTDCVESGRSVSFARFCDRVLDPGRTHDQAQHFWADQELGEALERWGAAIRRPHRLHVVVPPAAEDPGHAIWHAVGDVVGVDTSTLPLAASRPVGRGAAGLAVLRTVNRAVDGRLPTHTHVEVVRRYLSDGGRPGATAAPALPGERYEELLEVGERWRKQLAEGGYDVHGDTTRLLPVRPAPGVLPPDEVPAEERLATAAAALADVLVEVARLREHNQALEQRNAKLEQKKRKLKRRMAALG